MIKGIFYHFPQAAYLIFFIFIFLFMYGYLFIYRENKKAKIAPEAIWKQLFIYRPPSVFWLITILFCLSWILLTFALMDPMGDGHYLNEKIAPTERLYKRKAHEIILLIDASASMNVADLPNQKKRLEVAKEVADEMVSGLHGETVSLYAFTNQLVQLVPSTYDYLYVRLLLRQLQINEAGTAGTNFLETFAQLKKKYESASNTFSKSLVMLTDGGDTTLEASQSNDQAKRFQALTSLIQDMNKENHMRLFIVGVGSEKGGIVPGVTFDGKPVFSHLEKTLLKEMAKAGQGRYFEFSGRSIRALAKEVAFDYSHEDISVTKTVPSSPDIIYDRFYQFPLAIALLLLAVLALTRKG